MKKVLKIIGVILAVVIGLPLVIALFTAKEYSVEREVTIFKNKAEVFNYVKLLRNQNNYSKWAAMDPDMKKEFRGTDGTVGFVSAWNSQNPDVGKGEQEIVAIREGENIDYELRFLEPFESTSQAYMSTASAGDNATLVKWGFKGNMAYPMNFMLLVMDMEGMLGADLQTGLDNLKRILES